MAGTVEQNRVERELWGAETRKAIENFQVSGERIPRSVIHWLGRIKAAAARTNGELGLLDSELAERIARAADEVADGRHDDQFPIDVFQTGSGTSSHTNANEVIANLAGDGVHPSDHVNMGQSSNDVFPSAVHLAALGEVRDQLLPALERLETSLAAKANEFDDVVTSGRTHLMDAVPVGSAATLHRYGSGAPASRRRCRGSARSRSAARRPEPASTRTPSSPSESGRSSPLQPGSTSGHPSIRSRRRRAATRSWSSRVR
jgi:fumarate hydratase, class II